MKIRNKNILVIFAVVSLSLFLLASCTTANNLPAEEATTETLTPAPPTLTKEIPTVTPSPTFTATPTHTPTAIPTHSPDEKFSDGIVYTEEHEDFGTLQVVSFVATNANGVRREFVIKTNLPKEWLEITGADAEEFMKFFQQTPMRGNLLGEPTTEENPNKKEEIWLIDSGENITSRIVRLQYSGAKGMCTHYEDVELYCLNLRYAGGAENGDPRMVFFNFEKYMETYSPYNATFHISEWLNERIYEELFMGEIRQQDQLNVQQVFQQKNINSSLIDYLGYAWTEKPNVIKFKAHYEPFVKDDPFFDLVAENEFFIFKNVVMNNWHIGSDSVIGKVNAYTKDYPEKHPIKITPSQERDSYYLAQISFCNSNIDTSKYKWLEFEFLATTDIPISPSISAYTFPKEGDYGDGRLIEDPRGVHSSPYADGGFIINNTWQIIRIPLSEFGLTDELLGCFRFWIPSGSPEPIYIDNIKLVSSYVEE